MTLIDFIVTRKPEDPTNYRSVISDNRINLIEVDFVPEGIIQARKNLINYGSAPYVIWFDPDDELYPGTLLQIINQIRRTPDAIAILMLSDTQVSKMGYSKQINPSRILEFPAHSHFMRCIKREWLVDNVHYFDYPIPEWTMMSKLLTEHVFIIPKSGYKWIPARTGNHRSHSHNDIEYTRAAVKDILGHKYVFKSNYRPPNRRPKWQLPHPKHSEQTTS